MRCLKALTNRNHFKAPLVSLILTRNRDWPSQIIVCERHTWAVVWYDPNQLIEQSGEGQLSCNKGKLNPVNHRTWRCNRRSFEFIQVLLATNEQPVYTHSVKQSSKFSRVRLCLLSILWRNLRPSHPKSPTSAPTLALNTCAASLDQLSAN